MSILKWLALATLVWIAAPAIADHPTSLDHLLRQIKEAHAADARIRAEREAEFMAAHRDRKQLLEDVRRSLEIEKTRSEKLKELFETNEEELRELETELRKKVGVLGELFGTVRQNANDLSVLLDESLVSVQFPGRAQWFDVLTKARVLPNVTELERFWLLLQHEIGQSGEVATFPADIVLADGRTGRAGVTRLGTFTAVADGHYLQRLPDSNQLAELSRQPSRRFLEMARGLEEGSEGYVPMVIDPTRGSLLGILVQAPNLEERFHQGGLVAYLILALGVIGLCITVYRLAYLSVIGRRVHWQLARLTDPCEDNPLGRVLLAARDGCVAETSAVELCLDEAILRETPKLTRGQSLVKLLAAVAPLLGLLGTVTGMILTFQSISLFGTGDPKLMAGGISQALVTTVMGLIVAIPLLFSHSLIATRSRELVQILDEQSAGLLARGQNGDKAAS